MSSIGRYQILAEIHKANARIRYQIYLVGDKIAKEHSYALRGLDAVAFFLLARDRTPIEKTMNYSTNHLQILLAQELKNQSDPIDFVRLSDPRNDSNEATRWTTISMTSNLEYQIECFGDHLGEDKLDGVVDGRDALELYLINKHHWHLSDVSPLSFTALGTLLEPEMNNWKMTTEQIAGSKGVPQ